MATASVKTTFESFSIETDSPVNEDSFVFKFIASINLRSAPIVSPSSKTTTSPTTSSDERIFILCPSRITVDSGDASFFKASKDDWALTSWTVPIIPFKMMTAKIIMTSGQSPTLKKSNPTLIVS